MTIKLLNMKIIWFNNDGLKEILAKQGIEMICNENMDIVVSDEDAERIPAIVEEFAPAAANDYGIDTYIVPEALLNEIANFFINLYKDKLSKITGDGIYKWWIINGGDYDLDPYDSDVYNQVEEAIFKKIKCINK